MFNLSNVTRTTVGLVFIVANVAAAQTKDALDYRLAAGRNDERAEQARTDAAKAQVQLDKADLLESSKGLVDLARQIAELQVAKRDTTTAWTACLDAAPAECGSIARRLDELDRREFEVLTQSRRALVDTITARTLSAEQRQNLRTTREQLLRLAASLDAQANLARTQATFLERAIESDEPRLKIDTSFSIAPLDNLYKDDRLGVSAGQKSTPSPRDTIDYGAEKTAHKKPDAKPADQPKPAK